MLPLNLRIWQGQVSLYVLRAQRVLVLDVPESTDKCHSSPYNSWVRLLLPKFRRKCQGPRQKEQDLLLFCGHAFRSRTNAHMQWDCINFPCMHTNFFHRSLATPVAYSIHILQQSFAQRAIKKWLKSPYMPHRISINTVWTRSGDVNTKHSCQE